MFICVEQGANDLHMVQLMPLPPHHLLLQQNPEWFTILVRVTQVVLEKRLLNGCSVVVVSSDVLEMIQAKDVVTTDHWMVKVMYVWLSEQHHC